jgi:hypothetical protein
VSEPVFLFDEDLIALGKALQALYPETIHISGQGEAPPKRAPDNALYTWCVGHNAVLVTADFNMLRDQAVLSALLRHRHLRVIWVRQIKGQTVAREATRIIGRWEHIRRTVSSEPGVMGMVLAGNGQLRTYRTITDTVYEVVSKRRERQQPSG